MNRKTLLIICLLLLCALGLLLVFQKAVAPHPDSSAQGQETDDPDTGKPNEQEDAMELTKEYVIAHSDLTEADFEGIDFEDFVRYFQLTPERLAQYEPAMLLALYREAHGEEALTDYTDIYAQAEGKLSEEDLGQVTQLIWEYHTGSYNSCMVIDRSAGAVYYGQGTFLNAVGESSRIADFTEEDGAFLQNALTESGIAGWENEYKGTSEGTTGLFSWSIGLRLESGRCVRYQGSGVLNSGTPETMEPLLRGLVEHFKTGE